MNMHFSAIPMYGVTVEDIFLPAYLQMSEM